MLAIVVRMGAAPSPAPRFAIGRFSDNELILFDETEEESWIIYPPRSRYDFLPLRRPSSSVTLVEHHPWAPMSRPADHHLRAAEACLLHGLNCGAHAAVQAAVELGFNPFT